MVASPKALIAPGHIVAEPRGRQHPLRAATRTSQLQTALPTVAFAMLTGEQAGVSLLMRIEVQFPERLGN